MDVLEAIKDRHATRAFDDKAIDDQNLTAIVTDAQRTPSWGNSQPWEVYIATGKSLEQIKSRYAAAA